MQRIHQGTNLERVSSDKKVTGRGLNLLDPFDEWNTTPIGNYGARADAGDSIIGLNLYVENIDVICRVAGRLPATAPSQSVRNECEIVDFHSAARTEYL